MELELSDIETLCQITELKLSCFGCCGHSFAENSKLRRDIGVNTRWYQNREEDIEELKDKSVELRSSGLCKFVIKLDGGGVGCPLHPCCNDGEDLRSGHCESDYLCTTNNEFINWDEETRKEFLGYIHSKNLDLIDYSIKMTTGRLLGGFKRLKK